MSARRFRHDRRGVVAVEFALLSPLLITMFFGTIEVTQLIRAKSKLALAAQAIQTMVASQSSVTAGTLAIDFSGGQAVMTPFPSSSLTATIASVGFGASGAATSVAWQVVEGGAAGISTATACTAAAQMSLGSDSVIIVLVTFTYKPVLSYVLGKSYVLTQTVFGRPRNVVSISGPTSTGAVGNC